MVAPEEEEVAGVLDLVGHQEADGFEAVLTPVDIVSQEEVIGLWGVLAVVEESQQIGVLSVDIACLVVALPQTLRGASSSRKIGCCVNISLHLWQSPLISPSRRFTCLGTFEFFTASSLSMIPSTFISTLRSIY